VNATNFVTLVVTAAAKFVKGARHVNRIGPTMTRQPAVGQPPRSGR